MEHLEPARGKQALFVRRYKLLGTLRRLPIFSMVVLSILVFAGSAAPLIATHPHLYGDLNDRHTRPWITGNGGEFIFGTDRTGRDIYSRTIYGARVSMIVAGLVIFVSGTVGVTLGLISGYYGGWIDELVMRLVDGINALPIILVALLIAVTVGQSFTLLIGILSLGTWVGFARQVRAETLSLREMDYVKLARVAGASVPRILSRHILPGVLNTGIVVATNVVGGVILAEAGLSFLGVGIPPPTPSWGAMIAEERLYITEAWWGIVFPGIAIALTVVALVFLGDWLRDRLDPRLRQI